MAILASQLPLSLSATDFIKSALRLVGALRSGNNLSAAELSDCQFVLNSFLDQCVAQRAQIYVVPRITQDQNGVNLTLQASKQTYLLGNGSGTEDFLLARPSRLERVSIMYTASSSTPVELPMDMYNDVRWQGIANKSTSSILPQVCYVEPNFPDMGLSFWPVPTQAQPVILYMWPYTLFNQFTDLTSKFSFPPSYAEWLRFGLALRLAAEFPCDLTKFPIVKELAVAARRIVESLNAVHKEAVCDEALVGSYGKMANIYTGSANRSQRF
jgi:hypothetical protein